MAAAPGETREVPYGTSRDAGIGDRFANNIVITSKYTVLTFMPKNIMEQLQKMANVYFLLITIVMYISEVTDLYVESIKAYSTGLTLFMMMAWSGLMAAIDDFHRHVADNKMNGQPAKTLDQQSGDGSEKPWSKVQVGDVLIVLSEQEFPADIVPLACSGDEGTCYVSTANLDGETNLKSKAAVSSTYSALCLENADHSMPLLDQAVKRLSSISGSISAEAPQRSIHTFTGSLKSSSGKEEALNANQLLLRGTVLRNTAWCIGVVVYTGKDTRVVMNSRKTPMKLANLEYVINMTMLVVLATQFLLAVISDVMYNVEEGTFKGYSYLTITKIDLPNAIGFLFTFFVLYSNLMPISLYATMEVCNTAQAYFIKNDVKMYDEETDSPAIVRSTNLAQELGQVEYIFSDKTGTLTQNVMELKRVSIGGKIYGEVSEAKGFQGGSSMDMARRANPKDAEAMDAFLELLAVSHTVVVNEDQNGVAKYEAESPDEGALVQTAGELGWVFTGRTGQVCSVNVKAGGANQRKSYTVVALNAFNSTRKRMSVIVQTESGEYLLLAKGADNVMLERAKAPDATLEGHLTQFAAEGLRTLVIGRRKLDQAEFSAWQSDYNKAQVVIQNREGALMDVAEKIEKNLDLVGATAIEDKLQVGVGETIVRIRGAGVKLWVLTGDKLETARNIGFSTRVLSDEMSIPILDAGEASMQDELAKLGPEIAQSVEKGIVVGLMVTGQALEKVTEAALEPQFLEMAKKCSVVIACRVSPLQKAQMVALVRKGVKPTPVTLAVGDGANDVPMIQEAQVGVGIVGKEGRQAVNAADFAIGQFRFLQRLLLVHGRWNYRRTCKVTLYTFWRNAVQVLIMFYYSFACGSSGTTIFEDKTRMTFNFILSIPIIATGCFDQDVSDEVVLNNPALYETGRLGLDLNPMRMVTTLLNALAHSFIIYYVMVLALPGMTMLNAGDVFTWGNALYSVLIMDGNYRVAFISITWNWISGAFMSLSFGLYLLFCLVYGVMTFGTPNMKKVTYHMGGVAPFWVCLFAVPAITLAIDFFSGYFQIRFLPEITDKVRASIKAGRPVMIPLDSKAAPTAAAPAPDGKAAPVAPISNQSEVRRSTSSSAFDHPETGSARSHTSLKVAHPKAGDTSLVDRISSGGNSSKSGSGLLTQETEAKQSFLHRPAEKPLAQQQLKSYHFVLAFPKAVAGICGAGVLVLGLGVLALLMSQSAAQIRIHYDGDFKSWPAGTNDDETYKLPCKVGSVCNFTVKAPMDMEPPIWVYYIMDPYYQNYNSNLQKVIKTFKAKEPIKSSFYDTFYIDGVSKFDGIAWESDLKQFGCTSGHACTHDVVWTRPSAMATVQKPRQILVGNTVKKGTNINIMVNASSDLKPFGARKELVLSTLTSFGGRDNSLGMFLIISGAVCIFLGLVVIGMENTRAKDDGKSGTEPQPSTYGKLDSPEKGMDTV